MDRSLRRRTLSARFAFATLAATALVALFVVPAASAQKSALPIGVYAGGTSSDFHGNDVAGPRHLGGFVAGVWTEWSLAPHWSLRPELKFVQKGSNQTDNIGGGIVSDQIRLSYIEVPVLLRASGNEMSGFTPWIAAGPHVAFKVACGFEATVGNTRYTSCSQLVVTGSGPTHPAITESVDYGVTGGLGVDFRLGGQTLSLEARYDQGFAKVFAGQDVKNRALAVQLGMKLR